MCKHSTHIVSGPIRFSFFRLISWIDVDNWLFDPLRLLMFDVVTAHTYYGAYSLPFGRSKFEPASEILTCSFFLPDKNKTKIFSNSFPDCHSNFLSAILSFILIRAALPWSNALQHLLGAANGRGGGALKALMSSWIKAGKSVSVWLHSYQLSICTVSIS